MKLKNSFIFRTSIIIFCVALCFIGKFIPPLPGLKQDAMQVLGIFLGSLILWLTIGIDWPSLLCIFALGFVDSIGLKSVLTSSFGNFTFVFLLFTFICTYALSKTSIIKRITLWFINLPMAKKNGLWFSFLFLFGVLMVGLVVSPSVLFVVILPILHEIFAIAKIEKGEKIGKALLMGLGFTVSISSGMTTIAHVFPVLAMRQANLSINPLTYMLFGVPVGLVVFGLMFVLLFIIYRPDTSKLNNIDATNLYKQLPKINKTEIITVITFIAVIILWIMPDLLKEVIPDYFKYVDSNLSIAMPPILGTIVLCIVRVDNKPILKVDEAFKNVPWSSLVMCAATLALGAALTNSNIGIKDFLQTNLSESLQAVSGFVLIVIFAIWAALQTNVSSNMVTATLVATVATSIIGNGAVLPIAICIIGMLASFAFATPPSMPHIAIVAGSDYCSSKDVLIYGGILMILSIGAVLLIGYPLGLLIF